MTVNATDADDAINVNNGIIGYSILSEEPKSAQQMFTIDPERGIISVIGTGLDREVGSLATSQGTVQQLWTCCGELGVLEIQGLAVLGICHSLGTIPCSRGVCSPKSSLGSAVGMLQGSLSLLSPRSGGLPALWVGSGDVNKCLYWR